MKQFQSAQERAITLFNSSFISSETSSLIIASAPGRVELAGNHTDHQGGRTISTAIDKRIYAVAQRNSSNTIHVVMEGFGEAKFNVSDLKPRKSEYKTSISIIRGMVAAHVKARKPIEGFNMAVCSDIPAGSGVSSSAAFEMLIGVCLTALFTSCHENVSPSPIPMALTGMKVEAEYFGKPTGAQDQLACACGGVVALDFHNDIPSVEQIQFDFDSCGYKLCLINSNCDHTAYTEEFNALVSDMYDVAQYFGYKRLEDLPSINFYSKLSEMRNTLGDQKVLRAIHYYEETNRVLLQKEALINHDFDSFLKYVSYSGASSAEFLQNVSPKSTNPETNQPAMMVLALCSHLLGLKGAYRIHGGGFGGSVLAFVPHSLFDAFILRMNTLLGYEACMPVLIGQPGACAKRIEN